MLSIHNAPLLSPKRKRGVILSAQGWQRLQAAEHLAAMRDNFGRPYTLEQLSDRTAISTKTLTKVRHREKPVDQPTLAAYFAAFQLSFSVDDYTTQDPDLEIAQAALTDLLKAPLKGQLALDSPFYLYRPPAEKLLASEMMQPGALIRIRAPRQFGKTSLIARGLSHGQEQGLRTATVSLQLADRQIFTDLNTFLQWLCVMTSRALGLTAPVEDFWHPMFGSIYSCCDYFEQYLLPQSEQPLLLVLDEVNEVFAHPEIATDFFGMLRAWYERSRYSTAESSEWQKLRLIIAYSTDAFLPLNVHQSPFNVGLLIHLTPLTPTQVEELALRYGLASHSEPYAPILSELLGGNPYLTQLALFHLSQGTVTLPTLKQTLTSPASIFESHLRQQLAYLEQHPDLKTAMAAVVAAPAGVKLYPTQASKLQGLGLITFVEQRAIATCQLYQQYFSEVLG